MDSDTAETTESESDETPSDSPVVKNKNIKHSKSKVVSTTGLKGSVCRNSTRPISNQTSAYSSHGSQLDKEKDNVKKLDDISELDTSSEYFLAKYSQSHLFEDKNIKYAESARHEGDPTMKDDKFITMNYNALLLLLTLASFVTRFYKIEIPAHVWYVRWQDVVNLTNICALKFVSIDSLYLVLDNRVLLVNVLTLNFQAHLRWN